MKIDYATANDTAPDYHRMRAQKHREMAERALDKGVRKVHHQLADRHQALANGDKADLRIVQDA